jgi:short subunit dehydrogenase-like uncharacterized protein
MAGRSKTKLEEVRGELGLSEDLPLIVADASSTESLSQMAQRAKAVITTVGPYQLYGTPLVQACVDAGTDYVDLCGEPPWMHDIIEQFDAPAKASGARIVLSCGFDSIPFDLGVYVLQQAAIQHSGHPLQHIKGRVQKIQGSNSGGTAASLMETMARAKREPEVVGWLMDPFILANGFSGPEQPSGMKPVYDEDLGSWSAPFIMATINTKNVHRSNALLGHLYGKDFVYDEMMLTGPGEQGESVANMIASSPGMDDNPLAPGEGPSEEERNAGFYDLLFTGLTQNGERMSTIVTGDKDPGYGSTSKMISEAALCLVQDVDHVKTPGGVYTPAPAMGEALVARLVANAGMTFTTSA